MKAYIIQELWTDSLENEISAAYGYTCKGVTLDKDLADKIVTKAGFMPEKNGWPDVSGMPRKRITTVDLLSEEDL